MSDDNDSNDSNDDDDDDDDESGNLISLFKSRNKEKDIFYFKRIEIRRVSTKGVEGLGLEIHFMYNFANNVDIISRLVLEPKIFNVLVQQYYSNDDDNDDDNVYINRVFDDLEQSPRFFRMILSIGLCILPWYWMGFACKSIVLEEDATRGLMNDDMLQFWDTLYNNVLLEFMYMHKLSWKISIRVIGLNEKDIKTNEDNWIISNDDDNRTLIALGGGKDSLVALHLAENDGREPVLMYSADGLLEFEASWRLQKIVEVSEKDHHVMRHEIQSAIFEKNARSFCYPCGHPWAALVIFDSLLLCSLQKINHVSLGFERSADEGNGVYVNEVEVNHQYDKSSIFLELAREYINRHINPKLSVYSLLSNMWELEISRIFCESPSLQKYHNLFISCNEPVDEAEWCLKCEKCCFIFLLISAWLTPPQVVSIFGTNLFENEKLLNVFLSLVGVNTAQYAHKPFDCVGTANEAKNSVYLCSMRYREYINDTSTDDRRTLPVVIIELCKQLYSTLDEHGLPPPISVEEILHF